MTADETRDAQSGVAEVLAQVLAEHQLAKWRTPYGLRWTCSCGRPHDGDHRAHVAAMQATALTPLLAAERATERARIVWWLRAGAEGPAAVTTEPAYLAAVRDLADVIEQHPERFADAPGVAGDRG